MVSENEFTLKWRIQYGEAVFKILSDKLEICYPGVFEVAKRESEVGFSKFKMAPTICRCNFFRTGLKLNS